MSFAWTKRTIERLVSLSLDGVDRHTIAARLGCQERTVRDMQIELDLGAPVQVRRLWTRKEQTILCRRYPHTKTELIAEQLGRTVGQVYQQATKLGLAKTAAYLASPAACRLRRGDNVGAAFWFRKGQVPPNKGLRRPGWAPGRMRETQFKKGERSGIAAKNWKPIGTVLADADGLMRIKVREAVYGKEATGSGNVQVWPLLNRWIWQQHKGPIPPGYAIAFKGADRANPKIEDLEIISRAELMRRNTIHNRYPKEMVNTILLLGAVKRKLRERSEKHDDGLTQPSV